MPKVIHKQHATTRDTLAAMRAAALQGRKDLAVREQVEEITKGLAQGDYSSEVLAIYYWVCQNIRYLRDIDGVEFLRIPREVLKARTGDCDDIATLLAAMLMAAGNPVRFAIASFAPGKQPSFSHVYVEVMTPQGPMTIDPVANRETDKMLGSMKHKGTFPVSGGPGTVDAGIGTPSRHLTPKGSKIYSVYDYHSGKYDYYEGPMGTIPATGRYRAPSSRVKFGASPESFAARLPSGARKVGSGESPRGIIAHHKSALEGLKDVLPTAPQMGWLAVGVLVGVYVAKRSRR